MGHGFIKTIRIGAESIFNSLTVINHMRIGDRVLFPQDVISVGGIVALIYDRNTNDSQIKNHLIDYMYCETYEETDYFLARELRDNELFLKYFDGCMR